MKYQLLLLLILLGACKTASSSKPDAISDPIIIMQKTPCFGTCPEYTLEVYADHAHLVAKQHLKLKGEFEAEISEDQVKELVDAFVDGKFFEYQDQYTANISDMPTTYLTFNYEGKSKKVMDYHNAPESLKALESKVATLIDELNWKEKK